MTLNSTNPSNSVVVNAGNVEYGSDFIRSQYRYENAVVEKRDGGSYVVTPTAQDFEFRTRATPSKLGLMMVGWGGNNGSTITASILANRAGVSFQTRHGEQGSNYYGSVTQSATVQLGVDAQGGDVYAPIKSLVPMVEPNSLVIGGWDISSANLKEAMDRAEVLEPDLKRQVGKEMAEMKPLPSIYYPDFVASNQSARADNVIPGQDRWAHLEHLRNDIREFKERHGLDKVVVMWTASTERYADIIPGVNDNAMALLDSIRNNHSEIAPSTLFAVACILEDAIFINGSPQNTFVPGCIDLAEERKALIAGDDFKSGQTKIKSVLAQFLVDAGIKPLSIASYNHLGNNDGHNLNEHKQFRSKEISKSSVVDDVIANNDILFGKDKHIDHCVVIKYMPAVGDTKVAMDSYESELLMGGRNTITINTVCEDSLLASALIIDLVIVAELFSRVSYRTSTDEEYSGFHSVLGVLSYWLKAPLTRPGCPVVNGLHKQRNGLENLLRALIGLSPSNDMRLNEKVW